MPSGRVPIVTVALMLAVGACSPGGPTDPTTPTLTAPAVTASASAIPSTTTPTSATPSVAPSASTPAAPTPSGGASVPSLPALDVAAWDVSDFASQSGRIWCGLTSDRALCHFPRGFRGVIPSGEEICPDEGLDVTGIVVTDAEPRYFCSGDPSAFPVKGREQVAWHVGTGYPFVSYDGYTLAVLPYGKAIRNGHYICASAVTGVTCANRAIGHGFRIAQAGVTFF